MNIIQNLKSLAAADKKNREERELLESIQKHNEEVPEMTPFHLQIGHLAAENEGDDIYDKWLEGLKQRTTCVMCESKLEVGGDRRYCGRTCTRAGRTLEAELFALSVRRNNE